MRLVAFELNGFRRFADPQKLEVDGPVVAIVGPNEAGKTSLLEAMARLDDREPLTSRDRTRQANVAEAQAVLAALYLVEAADRAELSDLADLSDLRVARWLIVEKAANGRISTKLVDPLVRDTAIRAEALTALERFLEKVPWDVESVSAGDVLHDEGLQKVVALLRSPAQSLSGAQLNLLSRLAAALQRIADDRTRKAAAALQRAHAAETSDHPNTTARRRLYRRVPRFQLFDDAQRELRSDYDLGAVAASPPPALRNLALLAELDLVELATLIRRDESETVIEVLENANARLREAFSAWSQESITVRVDRGDGMVLRLHVSNPSKGYTKLEERSDGLKMFVALLALTARGDGPPSIVLIDELERHLHYDAQADVVQVFARQNALPQIIYTTHSAGCLPEDLGAGVRIVGPVPGTNHSRIQNRFWTQSEGFSPLLVGMGASTLAFVPVRNAVMTEGASDIILLPAMLREATGLKAVGFQIAPASSEAPAKRIGGLDAEGAPNVAWLVDDDDAGRKMRARLRRAAIPDERIVSLGGEGSEMVTEDLLALDAYLDAFNEELRRSGAAVEIPRDGVGERNRPGSAAAWCAEQRVAPPRKSDVAYRVLERRRDFPALLSPEGAEAVRELHASLSEIFEDPYNRAR
jgi:predicted ATP-dependent endonuclease of OLD family